MSERFFVARPLEPGPVALDGAEAHHLAAVCRMRPGARVVLFNGDGREYAAQVVAASKRNVELDVEAAAAPSRELPVRLEVAAPLPKGDRAQFLVEKLTELGVTHFVPLRTARSVVHPRDVEKLTRHVVEASKQCGRNVLMAVAPLTGWDDYLRGARPRRRGVAHPSGEKASFATGEDVAWAVGPEGGFTEEEVAAARAAGWQVVGLGPRILRVETAALALAALTSLASAGS